MSFRSITATLTGPCACCGLGGAAISCRTRGGTASLVGCEEFGAPSSPPRMYRRNEATGASQSKKYSDGACVTEILTNDCTYSGFIQYNSVTGAPTTGGTTICNGLIVGTGSACGQPVDTCTGTWTTTPLTASRHATNVCCLQGDGSSLKSISDSLVDTLSDEDLETDAVARLLAGAGGTWSAWTPVGDGSMGTCLATSCCKAGYQQRTTGITFGYQESQFKADITLLIPSTSYVLTMKVYRRLYGSSDPWVLLLESDYGFTTDGSGNAQVTDDVPNLEGYETYMADPFIYIP